MGASASSFYASAFCIEPAPPPPLPHDKRALYDLLRTDRSSALCAWLTPDVAEFVLRPMINPPAVLCTYGVGGATCWRADTWATAFSSRDLKDDTDKVGFDVPVVDGIVQYETIQHGWNSAARDIAQHGVTSRGRTAMQPDVNTYVFDELHNCATIVCRDVSVVLGGVQGRCGENAKYDAPYRNSHVHTLTGSVRDEICIKESMGRWCGALSTPPLVATGDNSVLVCSPPLYGSNTSEWAEFDMSSVRFLRVATEPELAVDVVSGVSRNSRVIVDQRGATGRGRWWQQDLREGVWSGMTLSRPVCAQKLLWFDEHTVLCLCDGPALHLFDLRNAGTRLLAADPGSNRLDSVTVAQCEVVL